LYSEDRMKYGILTPSASCQYGPYHVTAGATPKCFTLKMDITLIEVAQQNPDLIVSLKLGELLEFGQSIAASVIESKPAPEPVKKEEQYLSRSEVMEIFGISSATLWRWSKDYLVPEKIGNNVRYRMSDIQKRLEESKYVG
jgi:predicted DNA-binding transcriptional regulator AlpA